MSSCRRLSACVGLSNICVCVCLSGIHTKTDTFIHSCMLEVREISPRENGVCVIFRRPFKYLTPHTHFSQPTKLNSTYIIHTYESEAEDAEICVQE